MTRRPSVFRRPLATVFALAFAVVAPLAGCGGSDSSERIDRPLVRQFSPTISPLDFATLQQNPTFTDGKLTVSTSPQYPGEIVVYFQDSTEIDPASVFLGGDPALGIDPESLQITQSIPGTGNVQIALVKVIVEKDRIRCLPDALWNLDAGGNAVPDPAGNLANGQYSVGVFQNIRSTTGKPVQQAPVFMSFTVGAADTIAPSVVTTTPVHNQADVGAGIGAPQPLGATNVANVRTAIFGPTSPNIVIRFDEAIASSTVTTSNVSVVDAGAFVPGGGAPPQIPPAPGYPRLKSVEDGTTLPSNGFEILWRPDSQFGGFPFGTTIQVTVVGLYNDQAAFDAGGPPQNSACIKDLANNGMLVSKVFSFRTLAPPDFPQNPFPEYAIYWSGADRIGVIDTINQQGLADQFTGALPAGERVVQNVVPENSDAICTAQNVPGFDPVEISVDLRTNGATCHTFIYASSPASSEVVIVNTRSSLPVAILKTPSPGGISNQTGGGQSANVLCVTNSSANTLSVFDISGIATGTTFLNGPIYVQRVTTTGNTPRAVAITLSPSGGWSRDPGFGGPATPMIMYVDFTDGVVNTKSISSDGAVKSFTLGPSSAPNDVAFTPCYVPCLGCPVIMWAAITQGGTAPLEGKVTYYVAGSGCSTGVATSIRPDALVGDLGGLDAPAGLDETFSLNAIDFFVIAESGSSTNAVTSVTTVVGNPNLPRSPEFSNQYKNVGANPVKVAHRPAFANPLIGIAGSLTCFFPPPPPSCVYNGTEQCLIAVDGSLGVSFDLYTCLRGAGLVQVINLTSGARAFDSPISIPSVRFVASTATQ